MDGDSAPMTPVCQSPTLPGGSLMTCKLFYAALIQQMFGPDGLQFVWLMELFVRMYILVSESQPTSSQTRSDSPI
jgi:hypothetical protein